MQISHYINNCQLNIEMASFPFAGIFSEDKSLMGPSQPPPFSMPSKLWILHGEAKSEFFTMACTPESMFNYL